MIMPNWVKGTLVGHLLECAGQICGGAFCGSQQKQVPNLWDIGFPFAEVDENGGIFLK